MQKLSEFIAPTLAIGAYLLVATGWMHWLWLALKFDNMWMFFLGLFPVTIFIASPLGAYCLLFDVPRWMYKVF